MKFFKLFIVCVFAFSFISCSNSDDTIPEIEQEIEIDPAIIGSWDLTSLTTSIYSTTTTSQGTISESNSEGEGSNIDIIVIFSENPNISTAVGTYSIELTTDFGGGQIITQTFDDLNLNNFFGEWSLDENQLIINTPLNNTLNATITSLTENTLIYNSVLEEEFTNSNNELVVNIINQSYIYSR